MREDIIRDCQKYKAFTGQKPVIVIGRNSVKDMKLAREMPYENKRFSEPVNKLAGFDMVIGNFMFGYYITSKSELGE